MLFVLFQIGRDRYAVDAMQVVEVLPLLSIKQIPRSPVGVAGAINYQGEAVPVIDLSALALNRPAAQKLNTRIVLVRYPDSEGMPHLLGLIAEKASETIRRDPGDFQPCGVTNGGASYLGPVASDAHGLVQWITVDKLLTPAVRDVLFKQSQENT